MNRVEEFCINHVPKWSVQSWLAKISQKLWLVGSIVKVWWIHSTQKKELLTTVDCSKCTTARLDIELLFRMENLRIAQPFSLSGSTRNRFKRLYFWLKFLSDLTKGGCSQASSQDLEKGGGYFERVRSVHTTLTRIFIDLESVSDGLSEIWDEMSRKHRKFKGFFRPKLGDLQKKKKKKKRSSPKFRVIFRPKSEIQTFFPPKIRWSPK